MLLGGVFFKSFTQNSSFFVSFVSSSGAAGLDFFLGAGACLACLRRFVLSPQMSSTTTFKCLHCNEEHHCSPRKRGRQRYCSKPDCQRASKAASQRQWLSRQENRDYFRGAENCERVRQWRLAHPGYRRNKKSVPRGALQDLVKLQAAETEVVKLQTARDALQDVLQDVWRSQHATLVGPVSILTGHQSHEDIATTTRRFMNRGQDILAMTPTPTTFPPLDGQQTWPALGA